MLIFGQRSVMEVENEVSNLAIHDLTPEDHKTPHGLKRILGLSLGFVPTPNVSQTKGNLDWHTAIYELERKIKLGMYFGHDEDPSFIKKLHVKNSKWNPPIELPDSLKNWFERAHLTTYKLPRRLCFNLSKVQRNLLKDLTANDKLKIVDADKNLGPVILTTRQFSTFAFQHLNDPQAYLRVSNNIDPMKVLKLIQLDVEKFHKKLCKKHPSWRKNSRIIITNITHTHFAKFKIMPKLHKRDINNNWNGSIRPIVASPGSPTDGLSKWVDYCLRPYLSRFPTILKDSDTSLLRLRKMKFSQQDKLFTFDAKALYTSIPTREAIRVVSDIVREDPLANFIIAGLKIVLSANYFMFQEILFKQTCGIAMGTPVAPTLANLYLAYFEEKYLIQSSLWNKEIRVFQRYIDDLLLIWRPSTHRFRLQEFLARLRRQPGITWETNAENKSIVDFLDLTVALRDGKLYSRTYQKALNLYLYLPFKSAHSPFILKGLLYGLLQKYKRQHSKYDEFVKLGNELMKRLVARGYRPETLRKTLELLNRPRKHCGQNINKRTGRDLFFILDYNPNGPTNSTIRKTLRLELLEELLAPLGFGKIVIGFRRSRNLREILCTSQNSHSDQHPSNIK